MGHEDLFETKRYNRLNTRAKSNYQKLSGIEHTDNIEKKEKVKRAYLARSKTNYIIWVTHAVYLEKQYSIFEGS